MAADRQGYRTFFSRHPRLGAEFPRLMETSFAEDFQHVVIEQSPLASAVTGTLQTVAATCNDTIFLRGDFFSNGTEVCERVLAHELAHIVQKRRSRDCSAPPAFNPTYRALLEAEAEVAAANAIRGERARCVLVDAAHVLSAWGPAGHYYTSYFVMLAAGADPLHAYRRALFCQMPDQVLEFDATAAGVDLKLGWAFDGGLGHICGGFSTSTPPPSDPSFAGRPNPDLKYQTRYDTQIRYRPGTAATGFQPVAEVVKVARSGYYYDSTAEQMQIDQEIQEGLHALTGGLANNETIFRESVVRRSSDDLSYGLALHPYGDSFAHRQVDAPERTYDGGLGHARDVHVPDNIGHRFTDGLYLNYVKSLYALVRDTMNCGAPRLSSAETVANLSKLNQKPIAEEDSGLDWIASAELKKVALNCVTASGRSVNLGLRGYEPEHEDATYWRFFWPHHGRSIAAFGGPDAVFRRVRQLGRQWYKERKAQTAEEEAERRRQLAAEQAERRRQEIERRWDKR
jgi:hypothetical protein